ncbi:hypothetical protein [Sphingobium sp. MK2]|uniref:hypothetical protein n=1 Tax=Sphingobium sp. MK2 TaxID=3116540 RepID=UPI0032E358CD
MKQYNILFSPALAAVKMAQNRWGEHYRCDGRSIAVAARAMQPYNQAHRHYVDVQPGWGNQSVCNMKA